MNDRFFTKKLGGKPGPAKGGDWTGVFVKTPKTLGSAQDGDPAVITAFGGSDGGRSDAKRLAGMLNKALDKFYAIPEFKACERCGKEQAYLTLEINQTQRTVCETCSESFLLMLETWVAKPNIEAGQ